MRRALLAVAAVELAVLLLLPAPANFDKPGDSVFIGPNVGDSADSKITAKKGTKLFFLCAIHPWMQAKVIVG